MSSEPSANEKLDQPIHPSSGLSERGHHPHGSVIRYGWRLIYQLGQLLSEASGEVNVKLRLEIAFTLRQKADG